MAIKFENGGLRYYDKNGREIIEGCRVVYPGGVVKTIYRTDNDELGTDATNPVWIEKGRAAACEFGIYPLEEGELNEIEVID